MTQKAAKKTSLSKRLVSIVLFALCAVLLVVSVAGYILRGSASTKQLLDGMRTDAVIHAASGGLVDSFAAEASSAALKELRSQKDFRKKGKNEIDAYCAQKAEEARAEAEALYSDISGIDAAALRTGIDAYEAALTVSEGQRASERAAYAEQYTAFYESVSDWSDFVGELDDEALTAAVQAAAPSVSESYLPGFVKLARKLSEDEIAADAAAAEGSGEEEAAGGEVTEEVSEEVSDELEIDYKYFVDSEELSALDATSNAAYDDMFAVLTAGIPDLANLDKKTGEKIRESIKGIANTGASDFSTRYAIYAAQNADKALSGGDRLRMVVAANAEKYLIAAIALLLLAVTITFWTQIISRMGVPRTIILLFLIYLLLAARLYSMNLSLMVGNILERVCMYGILALAMLPGIQCGIGLNMGMTLGCISGLLGIVLSLQYNLSGAAGLIFSIVSGVIVAIPLGWAYSLLLNRMKGSEMTIATYVGFSFVSLMCIGWMLLPFTNTKIIWLLRGKGLRVTHSLLGVYAHLLDDFLSFKIFGIQVPTGSLLFFLLICLVIYLFSRSKLGIAMSAVGSNPRFAEASGINVDHMRTLGTVLSTCLAAIGIVIYSQSFGYAQLYTAPKQLGFLAASAILIGGATVSKAKVSHVIIGVFLFEGVLAVGQQIANAAFSGGGLSEVMRIMISNGIILYALTQSGGGRND